jgi:hypothetical protein
MESGQLAIDYAITCSGTVRPPLGKSIPGWYSDYLNICTLLRLLDEKDGNTLLEGAGIPDHRCDDSRVPLGLSV